VTTARAFRRITLHNLGSHIASRAIGTGVDYGAPAVLGLARPGG
jgi:hypothetical protein